jgi:hypothetical protein
MFGKRVSIRFPPKTIPLRPQCERCHFLTHPTRQCRRPTNYKKCAKCGLTDHNTAEHSGMNCRGKHGTLKCSCPPSCFNCLFSKQPNAGHWADSETCPLKATRSPPSSQIQQASQGSVETAPPPLSQPSLARIDSVPPTDL